MKLKYILGSFNLITGGLCFAFWIGLQAPQTINKIKSYQSPWVTVKVTAYRPIKSQTDSTPNWTSISSPAIMGVCAISQDLLKDGTFKYGDVIFVSGLGVYMIMDTMNPRQYKSLDILVYTRTQEKIIGVRPNTQVRKLKD